jgi:4-amino-4-deoxy-L-arabinose transferase-like glycosyltransferase
MSQSTENKLLSRSYLGLLGLSSITALESLIWAFAFARLKSEPESQVFLGLSAARLGIVLFLVLIASLCALGLMRLWRHKANVQEASILFSLQERKYTRLLLLCAVLFGFLLTILTFRVESWGVYHEHFSQFKAILWWGALISAQGCLYLLIFDPQKRFKLSHKNIVFALLGLILISVWVYSSQDMQGRSATSWMGYYQVEEFYPAPPQELASFFTEMRAGIPPALSLAEIISGKLTGSTQIITTEFYRLALLISYLIAAFLFADNLLKGILTSAIAIISMLATVVISAQNPELYDMYYPSYLLLCLLFLQAVTSRHRFNSLNNLWAFLAGLFLALAELSRPFVLLLMPFFMLFGILALRKLPRKVLISFLVPVLLISGGWHLKLLVFNQGQIFWSNHSGFNLYRAWEEIAEIPEPPEEPQTWDRRNQIHSQEHYLNSQAIQSAVLKFIIKNPGEALSFIISRLRIFLQPRTAFFEHPELGGILIEMYRISFKLCLFYGAIQLLLMGYNSFKHPGWHIFSDPQNVLLITTTLTILLMAVSEKGEEARLVLAVLPFISALPTFQKTPKSSII